MNSIDSGEPGVAATPADSETPVTDDTVAVPVPVPQVEKIVPADDATGSAPGEQMTLDSLSDTHSESLKGFDPSIHAVDQAGNPIKTARGEFAKKRGRKSGQTAPISGHAPYALPQRDAPQGAAVPSNGSAAAIVSTDEAARWSANLLFNVGGFVFGEELGRPKDKDEAAAIKTAFKNYYDVKGAPNIPPEIGLVLAIGMYAVPRFRHESMAEKVGRWFGGIFKRKEKQAPITQSEKSPPRAQSGGVMSWASPR